MMELLDQYTIQKLKDEGLYEKVKDFKLPSRNPIDKIWAKIARS